jgi:hypothetical protein
MSKLEIKLKILVKLEETRVISSKRFQLFFLKQYKE